MVAQAHKKLAVTRPDILTIIVPRHPERGSKIASELREIWASGAALKTGAGDARHTILYCRHAGRSGLFYRLCEIVFMAARCEAWRAEPLEPARLACGIITGPHTYNFSGIYRDLENIKGCLRADDASQLVAHAERLMSQPEALDAMQTAAKQMDREPERRVGPDIGHAGSPIRAKGKNNMKTPAFWDSKNTLSTLLLPFSVVYDIAATLHRVFAKPLALPVPVICVGGLTAGGAGKTPVALTIGKWLKEKNVRAFFLSAVTAARLPAPCWWTPIGIRRQKVGDERCCWRRCYRR